VILRYSGLKIYYSRYAGEYRRDRDSGHLKPSVNMEKLAATETKGDVVITYLNGKQRPPTLEGLWGLIFCVCIKSTLARDWPMPMLHEMLILRREVDCYLVDLLLSQ
jgi:hypothetical protein